MVKRPKVDVCSHAYYLYGVKLDGTPTQMSLNSMLCGVPVASYSHFKLSSKLKSDKMEPHTDTGWCAIKLKAIGLKFCKLIQSPRGYNLFYYRLCLSISLFKQQPSEDKKKQFSRNFETVFCIFTHEPIETGTSSFACLCVPLACIRVHKDRKIKTPLGVKWHKMCLGRFTETAVFFPSVAHKSSSSTPIGIRMDAYDSAWPGDSIGVTLCNCGWT